MVKQEWLLTREELVNCLIDAPSSKDWHPAENSMACAEYIAQAQLAKAEPLIRKDERERIFSIVKPSLEDYDPIIGRQMTFRCLYEEWRVLGDE